MHRLGLAVIGLLLLAFSMPTNALAQAVDCNTAVFDGANKFGANKAMVDNAVKNLTDKGYSVRVRTMVNRGGHANFEAYAQDVARQCSSWRASQAKPAANAPVELAPNMIIVLAQTSPKEVGIVKGSLLNSQLTDSVNVGIVRDHMAQPIVNEQYAQGMAAGLNAINGLAPNIAQRQAATPKPAPPTPTAAAKTSGQGQPAAAPAAQSAGPRDYTWLWVIIGLVLAGVLGFVVYKIISARSAKSAAKDRAMRARQSAASHVLGLEERLVNLKSDLDVTGRLTSDSNAGVLNRLYDQAQDAVSNATNLYNELADPADANFSAGAFNDLAESYQTVVSRAETATSNMNRLETALQRVSQDNDVDLAGNQRAKEAATASAAPFMSAAPAAPAPPTSPTPPAPPAPERETIVEREVVIERIDVGPDRRDVRYVRDRDDDFDGDRRRRHSRRYHDDDGLRYRSSFGRVTRRDAELELERLKRELRSLGRWVYQTQLFLSDNTLDEFDLAVDYYNDAVDEDRASYRMSYIRRSRECAVNVNMMMDGELRFPVQRRSSRYFGRDYGFFEPTYFGGGVIIFNEPSHIHYTPVYDNSGVYRDMGTTVPLDGRSSGETYVEPGAVAQRDLGTTVSLEGNAAQRETYVEPGAVAAADMGTTVRLEDAAPQPVAQAADAGTTVSLEAPAPVVEEQTWPQAQPDYSQQYPVADDPEPVAMEQSWQQPEVAAEDNNYVEESNESYDQGGNESYDAGSDSTNDDNNE